MPRTVQIRLSREEIEAIQEQPKEGGGFQGLFSELSNSIQGDLLKIDRATAENVIKYCREYGEGGWQSALESIADKLEQVL